MQNDHVCELHHDVQSTDVAALQRLQKVQPLPATLVTLAALGAAGARLVVQMPEHQDRPDLSSCDTQDDASALPSIASVAHHADTLASACRLHERVSQGGGGGVIRVGALQALGDAKVQCAVNPGTCPSHDQELVA